LTQLQEEMARMNWYCLESIKKWRTELTTIFEDLHHNQHWLALPYHTIAINRMLGSTVDEAARLAAIFRLFILSDHIHTQVQDDNQCPTDNESLQFNILIGDLLYGSALCLLLEKGWDQLLPLLTEMIVQINEGHAMALLNPQVDAIQLATREWGSYYRAAFRAAAIINNLTADQAKRLEGMGLDLGLSIVAKQLGWGNASVFATRYREGMDWLSTNLIINNNYKRIENWMADTNVLVPAAG